jgi:hypothetical protein
LLVNATAPAATVAVQGGPLGVPGPAPASPGLPIIPTPELDPEEPLLAVVPDPLPVVPPLPLAVVPPPFPPLLVPPLALPFEPLPPNPLLAPELALDPPEPSPESTG